MNQPSDECTALAVGAASLVSGRANGNTTGALVAQSRGGTRFFSALYLAPLSDIEAAHRSRTAARTMLHKAELMAASTGERVWDSQLSARRLKLRSDRYRSSGDGSAMA